MKASCNVIRDILPLYIESISSDDTNAMVEEHIRSCDNCRKKLDEMNAIDHIPLDTDTGPLRTLKATLRKKKIQTIVLSVMMTVVLAVTVITFLTTPAYIPYREGLVSITEDDNGMVLAIFSEEVSGYDIERSQTNDNTGYSYHITAWDSVWKRNNRDSPQNNAVLNPDGEKVTSVYYYMRSSEHILLHGYDRYDNGGVVFLPRLVLAYYMLAAVALVIICGIIMLVFHRREIIRNWILKIILLPISYLIGHMCIKGFTTSSYDALRDFIAIWLVAIPLYIIFLIALHLHREYKSRKSNFS